MSSLPARLKLPTGGYSGIFVDPSEWMVRCLYRYHFDAGRHDNPYLAIPLVTGVTAMLPTWDQGPDFGL